MTGFPAVFGDAATQADSHSFVLPHRLNRSEAELRAAYGFIAFMLRHSAMWAEGGHIPAYQPVRKSPEYLSMHPQSLYRSAAEHVELDPRVWFAGSASLLWNELGRVFSGVLTGRSSPRQGLRQAKEVLHRLLDIPNPTV